jgi:hypothetical protein
VLEGQTAYDISRFAITRPGCCPPCQPRPGWSRGVHSVGSLSSRRDILVSGAE